MQILKSWIEKIFSSDYRPSRRDLALILFAIFAFAFTLRLARSFQIERIEKDGIMYILIADDIAKNGFDNAFAINPRLPPLHILLIALGIKLGLAQEATGILISVLSGALMVFPIFFIARNLFRSFLPCILSALLIAVYPNLARLGGEVLRDPLFQFFSFFAIWMIMQGLKSGKLVFHIFAGISVALATLTRSEGVEVMLAYFLFCAWEMIFPLAGFTVFRQKAKRTLFLLTVFMISFAVTTIPFEYTMQKTMSEWHVIDLRMKDYFTPLLIYFKIKQ
jgi:4-amino-4-deoxy-L-arabinose transferase-like glycosyltransferase